MNRAAQVIDLKWAYEHHITGRNVTVAILDTGIMKHPDFTNRTNNRILAFQDMLHGRKQPYDDNGHGTHVEEWKNNKRKLDKASKRIYFKGMEQ